MAERARGMLQRPSKISRKDIYKENTFTTFPLSHEGGRWEKQRHQELGGVSGVQREREREREGGKREGKREREGGARERGGEARVSGGGGGGRERERERETERGT